jgi:hypothetical protein
MRGGTSPAHAWKHNVCSTASGGKLEDDDAVRSSSEAAADMPCELAENW